MNKDIWVTMYVEEIEPKIGSIGINPIEFEIAYINDNTLELIANDKYMAEIYIPNQKQCDLLYETICNKVRQKKSFRLQFIPEAIINGTTHFKEVEIVDLIVKEQIDTFIDF